MEGVAALCALVAGDPATALVGRGYWRPKVVPREPPPDTKEEEDKVIRVGMRVVIVILFIISLPHLVFFAVFALLATPFALVELIALGAVGTVMGILRRVGLSRYRVEVVGHIDEKVHSLTTLLVRGNRWTADRLVTDISATLADNPAAYRPKDLPPNVTVRSHKSFVPKQRRRARRPTTS